MDKEEDSVIKLQALSDRLAACTGGDELEALKTELVDFHGAHFSHAHRATFACASAHLFHQPLCLLLDAVTIAAGVFPCAGELVLLLHWSLLNYAAVVKILKKHGATFGAPHT